MEVYLCRYSILPSCMRLNAMCACTYLYINHNHTIFLTLCFVSFIIVDAVYEGFQKRIFVVAALLATLHLPFLAEIILLYKKLGPKSSNKPHYTKLLINADTDSDSD